MCAISIKHENQDPMVSDPDRSKKLELEPEPDHFSRVVPAVEEQQQQTVTDNNTDTSTRDNGRK